jgi:hypothetical protein
LSRESFQIELLCVILWYSRETLDRTDYMAESWKIDAKREDRKET